ncbi:MAG: hypothetical protein EXS25_01090 [Pedosphaera sp.]|nr:hypothetical protein [Pedosphaera sp.]
MNNSSISDQIRALREAKVQRKAVELQEKELIKELRKQQKQKVDKVSIADLATLLASSTQAVLNAAKDYQEKGFSVKIETDEKTDLKPI